ncbi:hypothetical protein FKW77_009709 [Venturia effusa]|uniref:Uncharacterized protein n=1 Tax=Venturia effusa TaxID=50376 RepID=A0A517L070_9PEZI|nr:hypothetical protein FKW77_009709 [Venturia effusa]
MPTAISYKHVTVGGRTESQVAHVGFEVLPGAPHTATCFKLLLDEKVKLTEFDDPTVVALGGLAAQLGKSAVEITTDFLSEIFDCLKRQFKGNGRDLLLMNSLLVFCITYPATWSDKAKRDTIAAAKAAGMRSGFFGEGQDHVIISISEPEAAAIAALIEMLEDGKISPGDAVAVCDSGGGTIDMVVYYIEATSPMTIRHLVPGLGGKFGSTAIDRALLSLLLSTFGDSFNNLDEAKKRPGSPLMKQFEERKAVFRTESSRMDPPIYPLRLSMTNVPYGTPYDSAEAEVLINKEMMESLFDPSVQMVIALVKKQIDAGNEAMPEGKKNQCMSPERRPYIASVGGFGSSDYLIECLKKAAIDGIKEVFSPYHPQLAVARGAAFHAVSDIEVLERLSRRHYGVCLNWSFEEGVDPEVMKYNPNWKGQESLGPLCKNRLIWSIAKGELVTERKVIRNLSFIFTPEDNSLEFELDLYVSNADHAPRYLQDAEGDNATAEHIGKMWMNFGDIDYMDPDICTPQKLETAAPLSKDKKKRKKPAPKKKANKKMKGPGANKGRVEEEEIGAEPQEQNKATYSYLMKFIIEIFLMKSDGELHFQAKTGATIDENGNAVGGVVRGAGKVDFT